VFQSMYDFLRGFEFTSLMGVLLYWLPASLCAYGYTARTWFNYQKDVKQRDEMAKAEKTYWPTDTIGTLIGRGFATALPVVNIWAASFDVAPQMFSALFAWFGRVFDQPIVPPKKDRGP
jgi:hypothetical protein